jgi:hypothetical protein
MLFRYLTEPFLKRIAGLPCGSSMRGPEAGSRAVANCLPLVLHITTPFRLRGHVPLPHRHSFPPLSSYVSVLRR